ncbi:hypothetical protein B0H13DRAFT_2506321 [Mycena leptocephala]|nr:hypothetical protein B0H13DRAFT_2506321 [Mycena leptocephala]
MEDAASLGFPSISLYTEIHGRSWDAGVYAGLQQFHQAKGFDPDSQDVARHLEEPLYQLLSETDASFAHVNDKESYSDEDNQDPFGTDESDDTHSLASVGNRESAAAEKEVAPIASIKSAPAIAPRLKMHLRLATGPARLRTPTQHRVRIVVLINPVCHLVPSPLHLTYFHIP